MVWIEVTEITSVLVLFSLFLTDGLFVAGINLTADLGYILAHLRGSVKKMTFRALPILNLWTKNQHPGLQKDCINIISGDFIERNNFVENVIGLNRKLLSKQQYNSVVEKAPVG